MKGGMDKLSSPPKFAIVFYKKEKDFTSHIKASEIMNISDLPLVAVRSPAIQSINNENQISSSIDLSAFVGCFASAQCKSFYIENNEKSISKRINSVMLGKKIPKVVLLFVCGEVQFDVELYCKKIESLEKDNPVTVIGGICSAGHIREGTKMKKITNGVFGVSLVGVPLRCVVSRGVESVDSSNYAITDLTYDDERDILILRKIRLQNGSIVTPGELIVRIIQQSEISHMK